MEKRKPVLIVYNAGSEHSFIGRLDNPESEEQLDPKKHIEEFTEMLESHRFVTIYDSFPIGSQVIQGPDGMPMRVPSLGTMNWCVLEGMKKHRVSLKWFYFPSEQGSVSQEEFDATYADFLGSLEAAQAQHGMAASGLQTATPHDLERMERAAKQMGLGTGPNLLQALKDGGGMPRR